MRTSTVSTAQLDIPTLPLLRGQDRGYWQNVWRRVCRDKVTIVVAIVLIAIVFTAVLAPWMVGDDPYRGSALHRLQPIGTANHWLGTDEVGRDIWARIAYGGRLSLLCGVFPVFFALLVGGSLGITAGFAGRWAGMLIMRLMDVLYAFPSILLAIAISGILGAGLWNTIFALTVTFVPPITRVAEVVTAQIRNLTFVEAARATGADALTIIRVHVLSNVLAPILVYATSLIGISIILAAGLSFLGLGVTPPSAEWGLMLNGLRQSIWVNPLVAAVPGVAIFITSMSFNLVSDGLRDAMDVHR